MCVCVCVCVCVCACVVKGRGEQVANKRGQEVDSAHAVDSAGRVGGWWAGWVTVACLPAPRPAYLSCPSRAPHLMSTATPLHSSTFRRGILE